MRNNTSIFLANLKAAARCEDWKRVDSWIPRVCNDPFYINWAQKKALGDKNPIIRDLGASILEKASLTRTAYAEVLPKLVLQVRKDHANYAGFRAACALANHGPKKHYELVIRTLKLFEKDSEVSSIAIGYLKKLEKAR